MRRSLWIAGAAVLVGLALILAATLRPEDVLPTPLVGPVRSVSSPTERALTFAVRAVEGAGLIDWTGTAYEFEQIDNVDTGWEVTFRHYECPPDGAAGCEFADPALVLGVAVDDGRLQVVGVNGEIEAAQEASLQRYEEGTKPERIGFELLAPLIVSSEGGRQRLVTSWLWSGPLPAPGYGAICRSFLLNRDLERVGRQDRPYAFAAPGSTPSEQQRTGGLWLSPVPQRVKGARFVEDGCRVVEAEGWRPVGPAILSTDVTKGFPVFVEVPLRWRGSVVPIVTTCVAVAYDDDGSPLATDAHDIDSVPRATSRRPIRYVDRSRPHEMWQIEIAHEEVDDVEVVRVTCEPWRPPGSG